MPRATESSCDLVIIRDLPNPKPRMPPTTHDQLTATLDWIAAPGEVRLDPPAFHPFPARMPVWLAKEIIERLTSPGDLVADPMVGSGTTAIAARQASRGFAGCDVDPMALLLARVGTTSFESRSAAAALSKLRERATRRVDAGLKVEAVRSHFDDEERGFLRYWFPARSQKELFALSEEIRGLPRGKRRDLAWTVFSSLIIAKSAGASYALDIARSRPHKVEEKPIAAPLDAWDKRVRTVLGRLPFRDSPSPAYPVSIRRSDARDVAPAGGTARLVVTSPPYINAIDYLRGHKFSLLWMGHELASLREVRGGMIGSERGMYSPDSLPCAIEGQIVDEISERRRLGLVRRYLSDMRRVLIQIHASLVPGGCVVMALGPSIVDPSRSDAGDVMGSLAEAVGFKVAGWRFRPLEVTRRSLPFPTSKRNPLAQRMEGEVFLGLRRE